MLTVDLTNCDREPIHIPGTIQPHGAMVICSPDSALILHASANVADFIGFDQGDVVGKNLDEVIGPSAAHNLRNAVAKAGGSHVAGALLAYGLPNSPDLFNITCHNHDDLLFVEFEKSTNAEDGHAALDITQSIIRRIGLETEVDKIAATAAKLVRAMLGYDRVMIYRFLHNGAGQVIAEAKRSDLQSFKSQHFPASDIPVQARRLYLINWIRMISDVNYTPVPILPLTGDNAPPIDMSYAQLRSVSPIHCEYLRNMGIGASLSISIVIDGVLWGLIACHHDTPRTVSMPMRLGAELFGQYFSLQIALAERRAEFLASGQARERLDKLIAVFAPEISLADTLRAHLGDFAELIACSGAGLWIDDQWTAVGAAPPVEDVDALTALVDAQASGAIWHTHELRAHLDSERYGDEIAGMLAIPLATSRGVLFLFRSEEAYKIEWAGEPKKTIVTGVLGDRLTPRGSFETWREEVRGQSRPWTDAELAVADTARTYLRDVALRHNEATAEERSRTDQRRRLLNDELNHRVKNIITLVNSIATQTGATAKSVQDFSSLLEGRLRALAFAHDQSLGGNGGDLTALLEAEASLHRDMSTPNRVIVEGPAIGLNDRAFGVVALLMHEMITNAAKYGALSASGGRLAIRWSLTDDGDCEIVWSETGGPEVSTPKTTGFGSKLIQSTISYDLGGSAKIDYARSGLQGVFRIPARHLKEVSFTRLVEEVQILEAGDLTGLKVMVVEDQALIAMDTEKSLRHLGVASVVLVPSCIEALQVLAVEKPDCAVLDFNLGEQTSVPVAEALQRLEIPFVFATGYGDTVMIPDRFRGVPVVRKPASEPVLAAKLGQAIAGA